MKYNEGNECPESYHHWGALTVLSSVISRRAYIDMGYFYIYPNLYVCLVGRQGVTRKTLARDVAYELLRDACPDIPVAAEVMSKEAITQFMSRDTQMRTFKDIEGRITEYRPFSIFMTELKNFISINPAGMVDFLTTIYDRKFYDVTTKNRGCDVLVNPYITILACETPEWLVARLRDSVISGGFCRRMVFVYEFKRRQKVAFPELSQDQKDALARCKEHLVKLRDISGVFSWEPGTKAFIEEWYNKLPEPDDTFMAGWYASKQVHLIKISILISLSESFDMVLRRAHLDLGLAMFEHLEKRLPKLSESIGRNELAYVANRMIEIITDREGWIAEKELRKIMFRDMSGLEFSSVVHHLGTTDQIRVLDWTQDGVCRRIVTTTDKYTELMKQKKGDEKK